MEFLFNGDKLGLLINGLICGTVVALIIGGTFRYLIKREKNNEV